MQKILLCLLLLGFGVAQAQPREFRFKELTIDEGLSHTDATCLGEDEHGFLWIGTYQGLDRFDGYEIKSFFNRDTSILSAYNNRIDDLVIDHLGRIWLGTQRGISCFSTTEERYIELVWPVGERERIEQLSISHVLYNNRLDVLVLGSEQGTEIFGVDAAGRLTALPMLRDQSTGPVYEFALDSADRLWILARAGLFCKELKVQGPAELKHVQLVDSLGRKVVTSAGLVLIGDDLWVGGGRSLLTFSLPTDVPDQQVVRLLPIVLRHANNQLALEARPSLSTMHLIQGRDDEIWIGSQQGLFRSKQNKDLREIEFIPLNDRYVASGNAALPIGDLYHGQDGTLWMATYGGGVQYLNLYARPFYTIRHQLGIENSISGNFVRAILEDSKNNLWIGTRGTGLNRMQLATGRIEQFKDPVFSASGSVTDLLEDRAGRVWVSSPEGLKVFHPAQNYWEDIRVELGATDAISSKSVFTLGEDRLGQIWAGSWERGMNRIRYRGPGDYTVEQIFVEGSDHRITSNKVTYIYCDTLRNEVLAATDNGLNHLFLDRNGEIVHSRNYQAGKDGDGGLSSNFVWPIQRTSDGTIYAGTLGGGLNRIKPSAGQNGSYEVRTYGQAEGNPSRDVETLLLDQDGNLWLGGNGLAMFDPETETFQVFDRSDGLQSNSFKIGSAACGKDGRLYFGGINGLNYFYPRKVLEPLETPDRLALSDMIVNQRRVEVGQIGERWAILPQNLNEMEEIRLSHLENNFTLRFSSFNYRNPGKDRYRYRLLGYQNEWIEVPEGKREATFANLDYGTYTFQVEAARENRIWHADRIEKKIHIVAPWWNSKVARFLYVVLFLAGLAMIYYYLLRWDRLKKNLEFTQMEEQRAQEMHLTRLQFFTNISHEFRTPLTLILNPLHELLQEKVPPRKQERYMRIIERNAQRLLDLINELMDFRKTETGAYRLQAEQTDLSGFAGEIFKQFQEHALINKIEYEFEAVGFTNNLWFERKAMDKVIVNLLSNAFKYTPAHGLVKMAVLREVPAPSSLPAHHYREGNDLPEDTDYSYLCVRDTGAGINASDLPHIFTRYYSKPAEADDSAGSTGVGLAMVRSIVQLHRGTIDVYSEPKQGTVFLIGLPTGRNHLTEEQVVKSHVVKTATSNLPLLKNLPAGAPQEFQPATFTGDRPSVLFVEDNPELRLFLGEHFRDRYLLQLAENGAVALEMIKKQPPNLIVSDIMMPQMDGVELCAKVKQNEATRHIPIILLTAKASVESRLEGIGAGADYYLSKPFNLSELELIANNLLRHQKSQQDRFLTDSFSKARDIAIREEDQGFMKEVMEIIENNLEKAEFDVDYLSRMAGLSRTKLYRRVKEATGESVGQIIRKTRVQRAAELLASNNLTVVEVMYRVGIQSQSHFTKLFKKEFNKTPTEFVAGL
ncbi:two-component regulator propeller domain-containing protein [Neolewinella lacunae]|uniref:histidine kinase n=1 Tax=Neolewinella lacunae TaxID=1517758 RepID=A0A923PQU9_9BACT|nr:hybrid sensor histidine kinase/response regulator transcription factor [Neolewinella lacunae]MBC6995077.1 response regulator [Neolewinella lacunae]MDN3635374.1 two-component regulator propeller domain-containing protein [Neolewinella lacunae]